MRFSEHPASQLVDSVYDRCAPLRERFNLVGFCYDLSFPGGELSTLMDSHYTLEPYYFRELNPICSDVSGRAIEDGIYTLTGMVNKDEHPDVCLSNFKSFYKTDLGIHFLNRLQGCDEMFSFAFSMTEAEFDHFILNNMAKLKNFARYFRQNMQKEIALVSQKENRFFFPDLLEMPAAPCPAASFQEKPLQIDLDDGSQVSLSSQQSACLKLLVEGKNIKEVAAELHLSVRTVENYLAIIRDKLRCPSLMTLLGKYGEQLR
jgi:hypothetical protein